MLPILSLALAGAAAGLGYCYYRGACSRSAKREVKHDLTRWEAEGGNVPEVDTPTPVARPQSSYAPPPSDLSSGAADLRH
jgi:hypothetical protein